MFHVKQLKRVFISSYKQSNAHSFIIRRLMLYPIELQTQGAVSLFISSLYNRQEALLFPVKFAYLYSKRLYLYGLP